MRFCFMTLIVFLSTCSFAQNWQKVNYSAFLAEYTHLLEIQPAEMFRVNISTSVFRTFSDPNPQAVQKSSLKVHANNSYIYSSEATMQIQKGDLRLDIDTSEHLVILSNGITGDLMGFKKGQFDGIDSTGYQFFAATEGNKRFLKVVEVKQASSVQTVSFAFDKKTNKIGRLEMLYWPANYTMESLDDQSLEQPKIILEYSGYETLTGSDELTKTFEKWLTGKSAKDYNCPQAGYTFHNLLEKKR